MEGMNTVAHSLTSFLPNILDIMLDTTKKDIVHTYAFRIQIIDVMRADITECVKRTYKNDYP